MKALLDAIRSYAADAASGPLTAATTGGFHAIVAPKGTRPPYCVITPVAAPTTQSYGPAGFSEPQIQLAWWDEDSANALTLAEAGRAAYQNTPLALASGRNFFVRSVGEPIPAGGSGDPFISGTPMYGWVITLHYGTN